VLSSVLLGVLAGEPDRIFVDALAEGALHSSGETNARLAELIADLVDGAQGSAPAFGAAAVEEIELAYFVAESGGLNA
jgi:hypothetical protein